MAVHTTVLLVFVSGSSLAADLPADDRSKIVVRVDLEVAVPADTLKFAEERAAEVFRRISVTVEWIDEETAARKHIRAPLTLVLVNAVPSRGTGIGIDEALGFAQPPVSRVHVFYDRIDQFRARQPVGLASVLGDVMAHELGHLLLPLPGHSPDGIMRPVVNSDSRALETFTKPQAAQIVSRLRLLFRSTEPISDVESPD